MAGPSDQKPGKGGKAPSRPRRASTGRPGGRVRRYAKVTATATGVVARLAGEKYLGIDIDRAAHARRLMESLGALKGPLLKVAQLLATIPNALPKDYARELQKLQSQAPPMGWPFVRRRMAAELGENWQPRFASFEREAAAAASLGQVHRARLHDGREVACKVQYPDMATAVEADLRQLRVILKLFESYDGAISTGDVQQEIADRLYEELDYRREACHQRLYGMMLKDEKTVAVPAVVDDLSTGRLLTTVWHEGEPVLSYETASQAQRNAVALNLFRAWYVPLYSYGVIHGDPHPGNYTVAEEGARLNLLDFGCVRVFSPRFVDGVMTLYRALLAEDADMAVSAYESWGFSGLTKDTVEILNIWARFLYGPVLDDRTRRIGDLPEDRIYGEDIARQVHQALRAQGGVTVPRAFVFMDRAALGLGSVFLRLRAEVNWHRLFVDLTEGFDAGALARRQKKALAQAGLSGEA